MSIEWIENHRYHEMLEKEYRCQKKKKKSEVHYADERLCLAGDT